MAFKRRRPVMMHRTLAGLPELDQFGSEKQKQRALREIEREAGRPFSWDWLIGVAILVGVVITVTFSLRWLVPHVPIVGDLPRRVQEIIRLVIVLAVFFITLRLLHRWGAGEQLREKLIAAGVPVCRGCGYSLRGLGDQANCCPECGRPLDTDVRALARREDSSGQ